MGDGRVDRDSADPSLKAVELRELAQILEHLHPALLRNVGGCLFSVGIPQCGGEHLAGKLSVQACLGAPLFRDAPFQQVFQFVVHEVRKRPGPSIKMRRVHAQPRQHRP